MSNKKSYSLVRLELSATPHEIGQQLGRFGVAPVHDYLVQSPVWSTVQQWKGSAPGLPRMVLTRAILDRPNVREAVTLLQDSPRAGAFNLNLSDSTTQSLVSVEFSSNHCSVLKAKRPFLHANHAIHAQTRNFPQIITGSSGHCQIRGDLLTGRDSVDPFCRVSP